MKRRRRSVKKRNPQRIAAHARAGEAMRAGPPAYTAEVENRDITSEGLLRQSSLVQRHQTELKSIHPASTAG
jgi:hypothetical protein